jgi:hypothetical protein
MAAAAAKRLSRSRCVVCDQMLAQQARRQAALSDSMHLMARKHHTATSHLTLLSRWPVHHPHALHMYLAHFDGVSSRLNCKAATAHSSTAQK